MSDWQFEFGLMNVDPSTDADAPQPTKVSGSVLELMLKGIVPP